MRKTTALEELLFLAMFIALFAATYTLFQHWLLPHGYNKMIVLMLTSIIVAVLTIFLRYWLFFRKREAP
jgi:membrane protein DedA with SNARE-associated domain